MRYVFVISICTMAGSLYVDNKIQGVGESPGSLLGLTIGASQNLYVGGVPSSYELK